ncbi:MAG: hypothetical protein CL600_09805 [Alteromonas sp.]|nr:hypothetical protein [Alteromonas sp.]
MSHSVCDNELLRRQNNKLKEKIILQARLIESLKGNSLSSDEASAFATSGDVLPLSNDAVTIHTGPDESLVKTIDQFIDSLAKKAELHEQDKVFLTSFLSSYIEEAEQ